MNPQVEELFHKVADLSPEARDHYFNEHRVSHEIRCEVEALLPFDSGASAFLERDIRIGAERALSSFEGNGRRCGPYRLLGVIGRGGMGAVYLAERADGEVAQKVAVKLLPPGASNPQQERFLQERQILAALAHPNIARMLDAGRLDSGQPFLTMEYVEGKPIDSFLSASPLRQKITLFLKVCAAVAYLHRNLVVHRDLKPGNILVTSEGEPKLLDFGIAKILALTTDSTITTMRMLTPDYASPEQVTGGPVSTATDIYSLGAVLYKLVTGNPPHEFKDHSAEGIVSAITTHEAARPGKWVPELEGDLEAILLKTLRKDPQERYATVEQLADDLEAFLNSRPVRARAGNSLYRARKFLRRYWVQSLAAALVIASLSIGMYLADRERSRAQRRFRDVRELSNKLFDIDAQVRKLAGSTTARQLIVNTSLEYLRRLAPDGRADPDLALELGNAHLQVARVQGVPSSPNLGQMQEAVQNLRIAEEFIQFVVAAQPENRTALLRLAQIAHDQMLLSRYHGKYDESLSLARKSEEFLRRFHAEGRDRPEASAVLATYLNVADEYQLEKQFDDALRLSREGQAIAGVLNNAHYAGTLRWVSAEVFRQRGDPESALKEIRESVKALEPATGNNELRVTMNYVLALIRQGRILGEDGEINLGRPGEAVESLDHAFRIADVFVHADANDQNSRGRVAMAGVLMGDILWHSNPRRALDVYDHSLRHIREVPGNPSLQRFEVSALAGSSSPLRRMGRGIEARQRLDEAFRRLRQLGLYPEERVRVGSDTQQTICSSADFEAATGHANKALQIYQELLDRLEAAPESHLKDAVEVSQILQTTAALYRRAGQGGRAEPLEARRTQLWRHWERQLPNNPFVRRQMVAATGEF